MVLYRWALYGSLAGSAAPGLSMPVNCEWSRSRSKWQPGIGQRDEHRAGILYDPGSVL